MNKSYTFKRIVMFLLADCLAGQSWNGTECVDCPLGTFQSHPYQTSCIECPEGWTTLAVASTELTDCLRRFTAC